MANVRWLGRAAPIAQVDTVTIALTWAQNDTIALTINAKTITVTIGTLTTTAQVATTLKEAWEGETLTDTSASVSPSDGKEAFIEHNEITATVSGSVVSFTHDTSGVPFTMSVAETTAGDGTATEATATAATGPNFADNVDNWDSGAVPNGDDVWLDDSDVSILYGLSALSGASLGTFNVARSYTGNIGLPKNNEAGYVEYRDDYLLLEAGLINLGRGQGAGSSRIKIDTEATQTQITVEGTGPPPGLGLEAFLWKGTHGSNTLEIYGGSVGVAVHGGEAATLNSVLVTQGALRISSGCVLGTLTNHAGSVTLYASATTINNESGTILVVGLATITTLNLDGGLVDYRSTGGPPAITTANIAGTLDVSRDNSSRTITTCNLKPGGRIVDPLRTIVYTNGIAPASDTNEIIAA